MAEEKPETVIVDFQEIVTDIIRRKNIHTGIWSLYVEFGIVAANMAFNEPGKPEQEVSLTKPPEFVLPTAMIPIQKIGIARAPFLSNLSVDAAIVNPKPMQGRTKKARDK